MAYSRQQRSAGRDRPRDKGRTLHMVTNWRRTAGLCAGLAIAAKPAGIAIDYTSKTMEAATIAALDAGIPVVLYNNNRSEGENAPSDKRILGLAFVGQNEAVSGEILAKAWLPALPATPCKVLIVNPFPTAFVLTLR